MLCAIHIAVAQRLCSGPCPGDDHSWGGREIHSLSMHGGAERSPLCCCCWQLGCESQSLIGRAPGSAHKKRESKEQYPWTPSGKKFPLCDGSSPTIGVRIVILTRVTQRCTPDLDVLTERTIPVPDPDLGDVTKVSYAGDPPNVTRLWIC